MLPIITRMERQKAGEREREFHGGEDISILTWRDRYGDRELCGRIGREREEIEGRGERREGESFHVGDFHERYGEREIFMRELWRERLSWERYGEIPGDIFHEREIFM